MRPMTLLRVIPFLLAIVSAPAVHAQEESASFNVSFAGIRGGKLSISSVENGGKYQTVGRAASSGLVGGLYRLTVEARASGRVSGNSYVPARYDETSEERSKTKSKQIRFSNRIAKVTQTPPDTKRKSWHADGKDHPGVLDPMTGLYALLRSRPAALACDLDISTFDGREVHRIRLTGGKQDGDRFVCSGRYIRVDGYRPKDLADTQFQKFSLIYDTSGGDLWPMAELRARTSFGTMVITRR